MLSRNWETCLKSPQVSESVPKRIVWNAVGSPGEAFTPSSLIWAPNTALKRLLCAVLQPAMAKCRGLRTEVQGQPQLGCMLRLIGLNKQPFHTFPCWGSWVGRNVTKAGPRQRMAWERPVLSLLCHPPMHPMLLLTILPTPTLLSGSDMRGFTEAAPNLGLLWPLPAESAGPITCNF